MEEDLVTDVPYQEAIGSLLFLAQGTLPDLAFAVSDVSRFNMRHGTVHWTAVKRILRYLSGTIDRRIKYSSIGGAIDGFVDADWGSNVDDRRSRTGWVFRLANGAVSWLSKRQTTEALSSTEAEYMAMCSAAREVDWLTQFLDQLGIRGSVPIHGDNRGALEIAREDAFRQGTKHIAIQYHFVRERVQIGAIRLMYVPTEENVADCLTKGVPVLKLQFCANGMGMCAPP